ncbi:MAG: VOC family protein [Phycisphaerae bacterium]|nr:VOC family protein [Phycisphaerae bacterium]
MPNDIAHFAIHADDCQRAKRFYESAFGWKFQPWGPPGFWLIETSKGAVGGSLQQRQHPVAGRGMIGFECTIGVADIRAAAAAIEKAGGSITMKPFVIERVGTLIQFQDTEGNSVAAMQYERGPRT